MGGGDMPTYAHLCDRVEVVRSLDQLDDVVDDMVAGALTPTSSPPEDNDAHSGVS